MSRRCNGVNERRPTGIPCVWCDVLSVPDLGEPLQPVRQRARRRRPELELNERPRARTSSTPTSSLAARRRQAGRLSHGRREHRLLRGVVERRRVHVPGPWGSCPSRIAGRSHILVSRHLPPRPRSPRHGATSRRTASRSSSSLGSTSIASCTRCGSSVCGPACDAQVPSSCSPLVTLSARLSPAQASCTGRRSRTCSRRATPPAASAPTTATRPARPRPADPSSQPSSRAPAPRGSPPARFAEMEPRGVAARP